MLFIIDVNVLSFASVQLILTFSRRNSLCRRLFMKIAMHLKPTDDKEGTNI